MTVISSMHSFALLYYTILIKKYARSCYYTHLNCYGNISSLHKRSVNANVYKVWLIVIYKIHKKPHAMTITKIQDELHALLKHRLASIK